MTAVLLAVLLLPAGGALVAAGAGAGRGGAVARIALAATALSAAGAVLLLARVAVSGPVSAVWTGADGRPVAGAAVDRLTVVLLLLVCGISVLVQAFAVRYLAGDRRLSRFVAGTGLLTAASAGLMTSVTLVGLAACWSAAGAGLILLLGTYPHLPAARDGVRRATVTFLIGDAALWTAVGIATARWGNLDLRELGAQALPGAAGPVPVLGCLVVVAALSRSAQVPFQSWLPATLAAPTPVSALLHAGVVNAGGVLLIRLAPLAPGSRAALGLTFVAGAVTVAYGTLLMLVKPDVKGALALSTTGQMGFMIMTCGLGLYAAAVIHLVLHGVYKASLFLASGTAIRTHVAAGAAPPPPALSAATRRALTALALLAPGAMLWGIVHVLHPTLGGTALLLFAWATAGGVALGWLRRHPTPAGVATSLLTLLAALTGYVALVDAVDGWMAAALPTAPVSARLPATGWLLLAAAVALGVLSLLRRATSAGAGSRLHRRFYVWALTAGHVRSSRAPDPAGDRRGGIRVPGPARATPIRVGT